MSICPSVCLCVCPHAAYMDGQMDGCIQSSKFLKTDSAQLRMVQASCIPDIAARCGLGSSPGLSTLGFGLHHVCSWLEPSSVHYVHCTSYMLLVCFPPVEPVLNSIRSCTKYSLKSPNTDVPVLRSPQAETCLFLSGSVCSDVASRRCSEAEAENPS